jgi:hypothetical protein
LTRSSSRARTSERGFVLLAAIVLAVLYFGLMELLLLDSARELNEAQRFRSRLVAATLAENAAEWSTLGIVTTIQRTVDGNNSQGDMTATMKRGPADAYGVSEFKIEAEGRSKTVPPQHATVSVQGRLTGTKLAIDSTLHSQ